MPAFARDALRPLLVDGAQTLALDLSAGQADALLDYLALLVKWNGVYNLTAVRDPAQMVVQHLLDSLAAMPAFAGAQNVLDVGAGGGLPGIVLAIWAREAYPTMRVTLVDTVQKKTAFLMQVKAELQLTNMTVHHARVEALRVPRKFDVITSRAFAELSDFVTWSGHLLEQGGCFIALKGVRPDEEAARLPAGWKVTDIEALHVPALAAERHLVFIERGE
ncbi:MAG TPA: 16S rRNA (guanine(527)-N(7))-methyltransferase RsmG [Noviherbaspirillum sp.]